jgi:GNAT superfamily N-acetyltransferase
MKFLIDTNIVIPLEPTSRLDLEVNTDLALTFHKLSSKAGQQLFIHPAISHDILRDKNEERKSLRSTLLQRYLTLDSPPPISILDASVISVPEVGTNDWVDHNLLAALQGDLVDYLVTEDVGIHKKAKRLGLESRVLFLGDAIVLVQDFFDESPPPPPTVEKKFVYELETTDPIFQSLRTDYEGFDSWLAKCKRKHREAYIVRAPSGSLAGIVILKKEESLPDGKKGKVLKICTFKVSESYGGNRLGELLLKPVFEYARKNRYEFAYFTAFPRQRRLVEFAYDFGFQDISNQDSPAEIALCKSLRFTEAEVANLTPLEFHIRFGPRITSFNGNRSFVVPIRPEYHKILFPEIGPLPQELFPSQQKPCGNSIRKAYLCHSSTKRIKEGDNLFFYRSVNASSLTCVGIVEGTLRSRNPSEIARFVAKRTVYSFAEIVEMCNHNEVLAIRFRTVCPIEPKITLQALRSNGIIKLQPQSITELKETGIKWLRQQIKM